MTIFLKTCIDLVRPLALQIALIGDGEVNEHAELDAGAEFSQNLAAGITKNFMEG